MSGEAELVRTVGGDVARESVAFVLPHERMFHEIGRLLTSKEAAQQSTWTDGVSMDQLAHLRRHPLAMNGLNLTLQSEDVAFRECQALLQHKSIEEPRERGLVLSVTTPCEGRDDCAKLQRLSARVPIDFAIVTCFDFVRNAQVLAASPGDKQEAEELDEEQQSERIAKFLETELLFGLTDAPNVCASAIYQQIHMDQHTDNSMTTRLLAKSCAKAQSRTGAPLFLSFSMSDEFAPSLLGSQILTFLDQLQANGATMRRVVLCHCDLWSESEANHAFLVRIASRGVNLLFDIIGMQWASEKTLVNPIQTVAAQGSDFEEPPRDSCIARCMVALLQSSEALASQILISSGILLKSQYERYGGCGFGHVFDGFHELLTRCSRRKCVDTAGDGRVGRALSDQTWRRLTRDNALDLLCWYTAPPLAEVPKHFLRCSMCREFFEPIEGEYFTKFQFVYCGTKCLRRHRELKFAPVLN